MGTVAPRGHVPPVPPLPPARDDLPRRRPVWLALSDLFLDTDVTLFQEANARLLSASPYSLEELDAILTGEVYPACSLNLWSVAGEWAGFDAGWLEGCILCGGDGPPRPSWWRCWPRYLSPGWKWPVRLPAEWADWRAEVARLRERPERSTPSSA